MDGNERQRLDKTDTLSDNICRIARCQILVLLLPHGLISVATVRHRSELHVRRGRMSVRYYRNILLKWDSSEKHSISPSHVVKEHHLLHPNVVRQVDAVE